MYSRPAALPSAHHAPKQALPAARSPLHAAAHQPRPPSHLSRTHSLNALPCLPNVPAGTRDCLPLPLGVGHILPTPSSLPWHARSHRHFCPIPTDFGRSSEAPLQVHKRDSAIPSHFRRLQRHTRAGAVNTHSDHIHAKEAKPRKHAPATRRDARTREAIPQPNLHTMHERSQKREESETEGTHT